MAVDVTVPEIIVDMGFTAPTAGTVLHIGDRVRGIIGTATIASSDLFVDVSEYVTAVKIRRGATRADGPVLRYESGTCTIVMRNDDRRFDPTNLDGPYVSAGRSQVEPMRLVQVRATWNGETYPLFRGFTDDWDVQYDGPNSSYVTVTCFDAFGVFASYDRTASAATGSGEDSGARINRILDSITWPDEDRLIDTGDETLQSTTLADNTLTELLLTADTELGHLFMDSRGRVRFRRRLADVTEIGSVYPQAVFGDQPEDGDLTVNLATNPSVEQSTDGWGEGGGVGGVTIARSSTRAMFGTWSILATWGGGGFFPHVGYTVTGVTQGRTYTISVYVWVPSGSPVVDTIVGGTDQFGTSSTTNDAWERLSWTGTALASTMSFQLWPRGSTVAGQQFWVDGLQVEEADTATDYIDGDQTSGEWDGLAHESTSRRLPELPCADAPLVSDKQSIANLISIGRTGGTAQQVEDAASRQSYLTKTYQRHDLLMQTDAEALMYAEQVLARASSPELRFPLLDLRPNDDDRVWPLALGLEFGDRIRIRRRPPGGGDTIEREVLVRGVEHEADARQMQWSTKLVLQAAPTITEIIDNFNRVTASGWGTAYSGETWTTSGGAGSDYSTTGTVGRHTNTATNTLHHSLIDLGSPNAEVLVSVTIPIGSANTAPVTSWVVARCADTNNYYAARLDLGPGTGMNLILVKRVAGALSATLDSAAVGTHSMGATWRIRFQVVGSTLRAKAWNTTGSEPASWQVDITDTALITGDLVGVLSRFETGNTNTLPQNIDFDNLEATALHAWV